VATSCGSSVSKIRDLVKETGDLGLAAQRSKSGQKTMAMFIKTLKQPVPLTIEKVYSSLVKIARTKGNNSMGEKQAILENLLLESQNEEAKFIIRWVEGNLNISAGEKTMQKALINALFEELFPRKMQTD
jgi:DNA ligase 1